MNGRTHYADDATLAYIAELRESLQQCQTVLNMIARPEQGKMPAIIIVWAQAIEAETKARKILEKDNG